MEPDFTIALFAEAQSDCRVYPRFGEALAEICNLESPTDSRSLSSRIGTVYPSPGPVAVESSHAATLALLPLSARHEWGEDQEEGKLNKDGPPLPGPLLPSRGGEGERWKVIALGARSDYEINQRSLALLSSPSLNLSGMITLRQTAAILRRCRLAVGAETGLAHIACAVGTPNVIVLGGGHFGRFMPYSPLTSIVCLPLECYGCNWLCRFARAYCVKDIVPKAIRRTLAEGCPKPRVFVQGNSLLPHAAGMPHWREVERWLDSAQVEIIRLG